jgi:hypothetical protein
MQLQTSMAYRSTHSETCTLPRVWGAAMSTQYQVMVQCKARAPSGAVISIAPGIYSVIGEEPGRPSVQFVAKPRQFEIAYGEFQRLKTTGAIKPL